MLPATDTIVAIASAPGRGAVGVVRVSGPRAAAIAEALLGRVPAPRHATLCKFLRADREAVDQGLALFFPGPYSFTGEDTLELQGHGGPMVLTEVVRACEAAGARLAEPGEFTRRAFLNGRLDLVQAEAVADLIDAASAEAARGALRSLTGVFSAQIQDLEAMVSEARLRVEAMIDFPEEDIDPGTRKNIGGRIGDARAALARLIEGATQGAVLREGLTVVLAGRANVGKSSLLNRLAGEEVAIVTPVAGTTRDVVRATVLVEGVPVHLIDTAGLRETGDEVEREGIARTWAAIERAGAVCLVGEAIGGGDPREEAILARVPRGAAVARVVNKIDLSGEAPGRLQADGQTCIRVSAKTGAGMDALREWLLESAGWQSAGEGLFLARERHLSALRRAEGHLAAARDPGITLDLVAEELRLAHDALGDITGRVTADDLLGAIFSRFCIGK